MRKALVFVREQLLLMLLLLLLLATVFYRTTKGKKGRKAWPARRFSPRTHFCGFWVYR